MLTLAAVLFVVVVVVGLRMLDDLSSPGRPGNLWWPSTNAKLRAEERARILAARRARQELAERFGPDAPPPDPADQRPLGIVLAPGGARTGAPEIVAVLPHTAAARIGLRPGDRLTSVVGVAVRDQAELDAVRAAQHAGLPVTITWLRDGAEQSADVVV